MSADIKMDYYEDIPLSNLVHQFDTSLREALEKHANIQSKSIAKRKHVPWFTPDVKEAKKKMHCREKLWRKYHTHELWFVFKDARRSYKVSIKKQRGFLIKQVSDCGRDSKKLYALVSSLMGTIQSNPLTEFLVLTLLWRTLQISSIQGSGITWIISQSTHHSIRIS